MKHTFSSLAALALTLSTSAVASPEPQLLVPGIADTVECIAVNAIAELIIGDPLAIAFCEAIVPPTKSVIKTSFTTVVRPTTVTATMTNNYRIRPTITSRTIVTTTSSLCTAKPFPTLFKRLYLSPIPNCVTQFPTPDAAKACSCLSLPIPTTTITRTATINLLIAETKTVGRTGVLDPVTVGGEFSDFHPEAFFSHDTKQPPMPSAASASKTAPTRASTALLRCQSPTLFSTTADTSTPARPALTSLLSTRSTTSPFSGRTAANANLKLVYNNGPAQGTYTVNLQEGGYYPFRIFYGQGPRIAEFDINVKAPDGTTFLSSNTTGSLYLVRFSYDGFTTPRFDPFGLEF
ncbi:hypothetical protein MKX08_005211 [Trichoderma sp. CBMAI-0020]|nr:hypothetical protein MKX08_005211 [Trichoderma sp. CBMAI-0020]